MIGNNKVAVSLIKKTNSVARNWFGWKTKRFDKLTLTEQ